MTANDSTGDSRKDLAENTDDDRVTTHLRNDHGVGMAGVDPGDSVDSRIDPLQQTGQADISIVGEYFDDEPPRVHATIQLETAEVNLSFSPNRARELANELDLAATHAEVGAFEAGWFE